MAIVHDVAHLVPCGVCFHAGDETLAIRIPYLELIVGEQGLPALLARDL